MRPPPNHEEVLEAGADFGSSTRNYHTSDSAEFMKVVLLWLSQQVIWISLICITGAIGYIALAIASRRRRNIAQFSLEREVYQQRTTRAWLIALLFLLLAAVILGISIAWGPSIPLLETATSHTQKWFIYIDS